MRTDRLVTFVVAVVMIGLVLAVTATPASRPPVSSADPAAAAGRPGLPPAVIVGWVVGAALSVALSVALLVYWMVVAWRAMRALEAIASSARRLTGEPGPRPAGGEPPPAG